MITNSYITAEINAAFTATGCLAVLGNCSNVDYFHCKTDLYLRYSPKLLDAPYEALANLTEIVLVTDNETTPPASISNIPCEIIKLGDLSAFLKYRSISEECSSHRAAHRALEEVLDHVQDAHCEMWQATKRFDSALAKVVTARIKADIARALRDKAEELQLAATATYFANKPPRFIPAACR